MTDLNDHAEYYVSLCTPREYTKNGGWSIDCECGYPLGDMGDYDEVETNYEAHLEKLVADDAKPVRRSLLNKLTRGTFG